MSDDVRFETYATAGAREWMMRCGNKSNSQIVVLLPFFHEANRLRNLAAALMRSLAGEGIASVLPDLPGCGESSSPLPATLADWHAGLHTVRRAVGARATLAIRTGALLDTIVPPARRWRLSPATGASLARDLVRSRALEMREAGRPERSDAVTASARKGAMRLAGYTVPPGLFTSLEDAAPDPDAGRTLRLVGDDRPADARLAGPMLWRQSEPCVEVEFATELARDFRAWYSSCADF